MKIEVGESLVYSWLRHVKGCQIVQTNWKTSSQWPLLHWDELIRIKTVTEKFFMEKYDYYIYKKTASLSQLIQQAECDAIGLNMQDGNIKVYAVDVAFHENGLNYGSQVDTVKKIIAKCIRTAMCMYGYFNTREAEIIFASPRIHRSILDGLLPCIAEAKELLSDLGYQFNIHIIANVDFRYMILDPLLAMSSGVADTNELFMRSYQMLQMFGHKVTNGEKKAIWDDKSVVASQMESLQEKDEYRGMKIGKVAQNVLMPLLRRADLSEDEIQLLQDKDYSTKVFNISYPLIVRADGDYEERRYYSEPVFIKGVKYKVCSQWIEREDNNDRPYLLKWIREHQGE